VDGIAAFAGWQLGEQMSRLFGYDEPAPAAPGEKHGEGATPRTDAVCDTPIMGTACTPHKWDKLQEHARQLEQELSQACLERDSARNVLGRAIERERLANMRATEWEEAAQSATERSTRDDVLEEIANLAFRLPIYKMCGADVANYIRSLKSASADKSNADKGQG
jgi:hypothetical protein